MKIQRMACCSLELEARKYLQGMVGLFSEMSLPQNGCPEMVNLHRETDLNSLDKFKGTSIGNQGF